MLVCGKLRLGLCRRKRHFIVSIATTLLLKQKSDRRHHLINDLNDVPFFRHFIKHFHIKYKTTHN